MPPVLKFDVGSSTPQVVLDKLPKGDIDIRWTEHALNSAAEDDFWDSPDGRCRMSDFRLVEVETGPDLTPFRMVARWSETWLS